MSKHSDLDDILTGFLLFTLFKVIFYFLGYVLFEVLLGLYYVGKALLPVIRTSERDLQGFLEAISTGLVFLVLIFGMIFFLDVMLH